MKVSFETLLYVLILAFINTVEQELEESNHNEDRYELLVTNLKTAGLARHFYFWSPWILLFLLEQTMRNKILSARLNSTKESEAKSLFFKSISFPGQTVCK